VVAARKQADQIGTRAQGEEERRIAATRRELSDLHRRRDHIVAQLAGLRDVVAQFSGDDDTEQHAAVDAARTDATVTDAAGSESSDEQTQVVSAVADDQPTQVMPTTRPDGGGRS
jgi:hypothetical protein